MVIPHLVPYPPFCANSTLASEQVINKIHQSHLPPSTAARNSELRSTQTPDNIQAVYNGRPTVLTGPCLSIYHPVFQAFMQEYDSPVDPDRISLLDYTTANQFVCSSVEYFNTEQDRFNAISAALQHFLGPDFMYHGSMHSDRNYWTPDGHALVKCSLYAPHERGHRWMVKCINEIKNGIGIGNSDATEQCEQGYVLVCTSPFGAHFGVSACYVF